MTPEQVQAFIAKMDGFMLITGAPGTGKTTVALQRIRFLLNQQSEVLNPTPVRHSAASTRIFLASDNLQSYVQQLLTSELQLPDEIVSVTPEYIVTYLKEKWAHKNGAMLRTREIDEVERRGREAFYSTCSQKVLNEIWYIFELQIKKRLGTAADSKWSRIVQGDVDDSVAPRLEELLESFYDKLTADVSVVDDPRDSALRMDSLFSRSHTEYEKCRDAVATLPGENTRAQFDSAFANWLYWVYDPLEALDNYFRENRDDGIGRVYAGIGDYDEASNIVNKICEDSKPSLRLGRGRIYGPEQLSWIAWLLRFALPEELDSKQRFRAVSVALPRRDKSYGRWNHVVIDEAQDLAVQEASFLASLVTLRGALTVSADFRQLVSPVHGMKDIEPLKFGSSMRKAEEFSPFRFGQNLRQSREIGTLLAHFYQTSFGEKAPFRPGREPGQKPELHLGPALGTASCVARILNTLGSKPGIRSIAILQIDENPTTSTLLRNALKAEQVVIGELGTGARVVLSSAERAKGLEFDACIVVGLEDVEHSPLNHSKNRAYVALSRPARELHMVCSEFPTVLQRVPPSTYTQKRF
jgi:superfamily I DNA/RNA helicase